MHPFALVPLATLLASGALAGAITAREPDRLSNRLTGLSILCAGFWALCMLLWNATPDPEQATRLIRIASIGTMPAGPMLMHLLVSSIPNLARFHWAVPWSYGAAALGVVVGVATPWATAGVSPAPWGWSMVGGPALPIVYLGVAGLPAGVAIGWMLNGARSSLPRSQTLPIIAGGIVCFLAGTLSEAVFPALRIPCPPLGAAGMVAWGATAWFTIYRHRVPKLTPADFAREILETLPHGIALVRPDGRIRAANERLGALLGRPTGELLGLPVAELVPSPDPSEPEEECEIPCRDGELRPVSISRTPLSGVEGAAVGQVLVLRDLREVASLRSRLVASGRLAAVGQLAAGIAHEINNPLSYVRANTLLLEHHWSAIGKELGRNQSRELLRAFAEGPELMAEAREGMDRVAAIVRDVGGFSRSGSGRREQAALRELIDTALRVASPQIKGLRLERSGGPLPLVHCVPQELTQVFLNLLLNAAHALEGRGSIHVSGRREGDHAVVEISDDGPGIPEEILPRIFEPFFTTKEMGEGTGLGLAISEQIVTRYGGRLHVDSKPGLGTTFRVRLPLMAEDEGTAP